MTDWVEVSVGGLCRRRDSFKSVGIADNKSCPDACYTKVSE